MGLYPQIEAFLKEGGSRAKEYVESQLGGKVVDGDDSKKEK